MTRIRTTAAAALWLLLAPAALAVAPVKSPDDPREYLAFELANGLRALVISDPTTEKAAAALDVAVGSAADPQDRAGLAHFLEHMLFLGTDRYPQPGEYQQFITEHGGDHNAYTDFEHTNYFFDIDARYLEPALDRFSRFFVAPLFNPEYVEREKNAVHSEYQTKVKDDLRRTYAVMQQVMNPEHPASRFAVGSLETLADRPGRPVREDLLAFYRRHYAAGRMALTVLGREPVEVLRAWVEARFAEVADGDTRAAPIEAPLFAPGTLPMRVDVEPVKEKRALSLVFPVPPPAAHYRSKPLDYLAHLIGHEGEGSLLSALKRRGWAEGLSAGAAIEHRNAAAMLVNVELTRAGLEHVEDITRSVFEYVNLIRERDVDSWRFEEQARLYALRFRFQERSEPIQYVSSLARDMHEYPIEDVLRAAWLADRWDPELVREYLARLTPDNLLMVLVAPEVETDRRDPWYDTPYAVRPIPQATLAAWRTAVPAAALALPEPNPFIPEDLTVKRPRRPTDVPAQLHDSRLVELWHRQDTEFRQPRATFYFSVRSAAANDSPRHAVLTELYVKLVKDQINEFAYPATLAGLSFDLYRHVRGFTVKLAGFNDKQPLLLEAVLARLRAPVIAAERFALAKEELVRELENTRMEPPYAQAMQEVTNLLLRPYWTVAQRLEALAPLEPQDLAAFVPLLLERIYVVALSHGNVLAGEALALAERIERALLAGRLPHDVAPAEVVKLAAGDYYGRVLEIEHPDAALAVYHQGPDKRFRSRALTELLGQILSAPFYGELRTDKQLGYVVFAGATPLLDVPGLVFVVQSPIADPGTIETHVQAFLHDFRGFVAAMDAQTFDSHKRGVLNRILDQEQRLQQRSDRYWEELDLGYTRFDARERLARALAELERPDLLAFYDEVLTGARARRLTVHVPGTRAGALSGRLQVAPAFDLIEDPTTFGRDKPRYAAGAHAGWSAGPAPAPQALQ